ncbi:reverse transcriptase domain-containing protein [Tanacetum coccineum]
MDTTMSRQNNAFKNELRNELTNDIKNMMSSFFQMNTASSSGSGSLPRNIHVAYPIAKTPVNENCSAVIRKKLPEKLGDPDKFLIPCDFLKIVECLALANLGASINLMPLSIWKKLSHLELTPTRMILELADRSTTSPSGIAEDVFVKVGKFHFLADFVVVDYVVDPRVPLILGRPFMRTVRALINVYGEELNLRVNDEAHNLKVDPILSTFFPSLTPFEGGDFIFEEIEACLTNDSIPPGIDDADFDPEGDLLLLEKLLPSSPLPPKELHFEEFKMIKSSIDDPLELELKDLPSHLEYAFLQGTNKLPVIISKELKDEEKAALLKVLKSHKWAIAWKIFDINSNWRFNIKEGCMMAIFHDMIEEKIEVFMDDFLVFGDSFSSCLSHLDKMLKRCEDTNLVLNWEKCHFMVKESIVLGHKISMSGIEVDKAKVDVIAKLPIPSFGSKSFKVS